MSVLRFSVFELDDERGELCRAGRRVPLAHQPFIVLRLLACRSGQVVTRDELRQAVWGHDTHVDFDRGLNFCIASVRRALGDDARRPRFIETVPKRGYRFLADVHGVAAPPQVAKPASPARHNWRLASAAALSLLLVQGAAVAPVHTRATTVPAALVAFERGDYDSALSLDERFAEAHYMLAARYLQLGRRRVVPQRPALEQARASVGRAIALEEAPESRRLLASLKLIVDWDFEGARRDMLRALDQAPRWDLGLSAYADVLSAMGDDEGALAAVARAESLSPGCTLFAMQSAVLHYRARRFPEALEKLHRAEALGSPHEVAAAEWARDLHDLALRIYIQQRDWPAASREAVTLADADGATPARLRVLASMPARDAIAEYLLVSAELTRPEALRGSASASRLGVLNALAGRTDEALAWLERSAIDREIDFLFTLRDPALDALRELPRYRSLFAHLSP